MGFKNLATAAGERVKNRQGNGEKLGDSTETGSDRKLLNKYLCTN